MISNRMFNDQVKSICWIKVYPQGCCITNKTRLKGENISKRLAYSYSYVPYGVLVAFQYFKHTYKYSSGINVNQPKIQYSKVQTHIIVACRMIVYTSQSRENIHENYLVLLLSLLRWLRYGRHDDPNYIITTLLLALKK